MIYLLSYFKSGHTSLVNDVVAFFNMYQRFDDGDYRTPRSYPYFGNKSCYGKHTCFWGVVKLLKGLVHIPKSERTRDTNDMYHSDFLEVLWLLTKASIRSPKMEKAIKIL